MHDPLSPEDRSRCPERGKAARSRRTAFFLISWLSLLTTSVAAAPPLATGEPFRLPAPVPYRIGSWDPTGLGHHRVVLEVESAAPAILARMAWRRRDSHPENKALVVTDAAGRQIDNMIRGTITRESGEIVFEPSSGPGTYFVYYRPFRLEGNKHYPKTVYPAPVPHAAEDWRRAIGEIEESAARDRLPRAKVVAIEAVSAFDSFWPMEVIAARAETEALHARHPSAAFWLFPEDRRFPIRMRHDLPWRWIDRARREPAGSTDRSAWPSSGTARPGEFYAFQLGLWAIAPLDEIRLEFSDLSAADHGGRLAAEALRCFNLGGIGPDGRHFEKSLSLEAGAIQALWCGLQVPAEAAAGSYRGRITVSATIAGEPGVGSEQVIVPVKLMVSGTPIEEAGDNEPWRHSRLRWLDSRIGFDDGVTAPFTPVAVEGPTLSVLGRRLTLGPNGLPERIESLFSPEMTSIREQPRSILARPIAFVIETEAGRPLAWHHQGFRITEQHPGWLTWQARSTAGPLTAELAARLDYDGNIDIRTAITTSAPLRVADIRLEIPYASDVARFLLGMGRRGGRCPDRLDWSWDVHHNQEGAWVGDVNAGLQFALRDEHYRRPLNTNFYQKQPLILPASWHNDGKGGCRLRTIDAQECRVECFSGPRALSPSRPLRFDLRLVPTPFKPIDPARQFRTRFYHAYEPPEKIAAAGANTINIHHATPINPFINYPFLRTEELRAYVDKAHDLGMKVKIYNTVRELSNHAPELFALFSLGNEIFSTGPGGGPPWLQEHLEGNDIPGWFVPELRDAAVINAGVSRWHNAYLAGIDWVARHTRIDGLYIDDIAFDRVTMQRLRKILDHDRPGALIDLHSANQYNERDGFINSALLYMEHFPYLDRLWFGEYFDYGSDPDFWLTEVSGIPFGLMGEMLQDGGNPWRGMIYGMTSRVPWAGDPRPLWKIWDAFGIEQARMIGYWVPSAPVKTSRPDILATSYVRRQKTLIAVASWAPEACTVRLQIDWRRLGLDPARCRLQAPPIEGFQEAHTFDPGQPIPIDPARGWLLVARDG